jgi:hypothetical protein
MQQRATRFAAETNGIAQISRIAKAPIDGDDGFPEEAFDLGCANAEACASLRIGEPLDGAKLEHRALVFGQRCDRALQHCSFLLLVHRHDFAPLRRPDGAGRRR